jgi:DNA-binding NarL/FixJ family response regulator
MPITVQIINKNSDLSLSPYIHDEFIKILTEHDDELAGFNYAKINKPEILIFYYNTDLNTPKFITFFTNELPDCKVLMVGNKLSTDNILGFLGAGAYGCINQEFFESQLNMAIKAINKGEMWVSRKISTIFINRLRNAFV